MRGLPGCGKSHRARRLAGDSGIVLETDEYFYTHVGSDKTSYDFDKDLLPAARKWNFARMCDAISRELSPIGIDRGNGLNAGTREFALYATEHGYEVQLAEPDSSWWLELRVLLKYKEFVSDALYDNWSTPRAAPRFLERYITPGGGTLRTNAGPSSFVRVTASDCGRVRLLGYIL